MEDIPPREGREDRHFISPGGGKRDRYLPPGGRDANTDIPPWEEGRTTALCPEERKTDISSPLGRPVEKPHKYPLGGREEKSFIARFARLPYR